MLRVKYYPALILALGILCQLTACQLLQHPAPQLDFPEGNVEMGKKVFVKMRCYHCHIVEGTDIPIPEFTPPPFVLHLGGEVHSVKSYTELVASVTNPEHIISEKYLDQLGDFAKKEKLITLMPTYNDEMTVAQLIDLIAFLDSKYRKLGPLYKVQNQD